MKFWGSILVLVWVAIAGTQSKAASNSTWSPIMTGHISSATCASFPNGHWLSLPIDPQNPAEAKFNFFYTLNHPINWHLPTALFVDGGPGAIVSPTRMPNQNRFNNAQWNLVSFHVRGAGCSQLPLNAFYDKFITTQFVVDDMEALRLHLKIGRWNLVLGESYGSWLAQQYAFKRPAAVERLVVEGVSNPLWENQSSSYEPDMLKQKVDVLTKLISEINKRLVVPLNSSELKTTGPKIKQILEQFNLDSVANAITDSMRFVLFPDKIQLLMSRMQPLQSTYWWASLDPSFFEALDLSGFIGVLPLNRSLKDKQDASAAALVKALFPGHVSREMAAKSQQVLSLGLADTSDNGKIFPLESERAHWKLEEDEYAQTVYPTHITPTIYINGDMDGTTPLQGATAMAEKTCKGACLFVSVPGGGHAGADLTKNCYFKMLSRFVKNGISSATGALEGKSCNQYSKLKIQPVLPEGQ